MLYIMVPHHAHSMQGEMDDTSNLTTCIRGMVEHHHMPEVSTTYLWDVISPARYVWVIPVLVLPGTLCVHAVITHSVTAYSHTLCTKTVYQCGKRFHHLPTGTVGAHG